MEKTRVVYVRDADDFRLETYEKHLSPLSSRIRNIRAACASLKSKVQTLPERVGVVTLDFVCKKMLPAIFKRSDSPTTFYTPLDLLERAIALEKENTEDNPLAREFVYRSLMLLAMDPSINLDEQISNQGQPSLWSAIPIIPNFCLRIKELLLRLKKYEGIEAELEQIQECVSDLEENAPSFQNIKKVYEICKRRFEANRVSREFPLFAFPKNLVRPSLFSVSLFDRVETPDYLVSIMKYIKLGCQAGGLSEVPEEIVKEPTEVQRDLFGQTQRIDCLDELLEALPEPRTIITDTYLVDHFPEFSEHDLETIEFLRQE